MGLAKTFSCLYCAIPKPGVSRQLLSLFYSWLLITASTQYVFQALLLLFLLSSNSDGWLRHKKKGYFYIRFRTFFRKKRIFSPFSWLSLAGSKCEISIKHERQLFVEGIAEAEDDYPLAAVSRNGLYETCNKSTHTMSNTYTVTWKLGAGKFTWLLGSCFDKLCQ